jgi:GTP cyclohydrolase II
VISPVNVTPARESKIAGRGGGEDERDHGAAAQMPRALGADRIRSLSDNPDKAARLDLLGVTVAERVLTGVHLSESNARNLATKRDHTAHTLALPLS